MKRGKIIFVGDSHTNAIISALKEYGNSPADFSLVAHGLQRTKNGALIGTLSFEDLLLSCDQLELTDLVVSAIGGNQHSMISLVQHDKPFDIFDADMEHSERIVESEVVPRAVMKAFFESRFRSNDGRRIKEIAARGRHRTVHVCSPPPKEDDAHILRRFETAFATRGLLEKGVSPAQLRLRVWRLQNEVLGAILAEAGVALLPPPAGTTTADGFLAPEFYAADATHASAAYGRLLVEQVLDFARNERMDIPA